MLRKLTVGKKYVVSWVGKSLDGTPVYKLRGVRLPLHCFLTGYKACRFQLADKRKDWVAEFRRMAENCPRNAKVSDLVDFS